MISTLNPKRITYVLVIVAFFLNLSYAQEWREISAAELQQKTPVVEPDADAEAIFWEVRIDDSSPDVLVMKHYVRVKIFTERGREKFAKVDIKYLKGAKVKEIMARIVRPDGSISELAKTDILDREIASVDKVKVKAKSFAIPNIEPGVIVEYQYKEVLPGSWANNMRLILQRDIPIRNSSYYLKPAYAGRLLIFNMSEKGLVKDKNGFYRMTLENVPALKEEPRMPPEDEVRSWALVYYTDPKIDVKDFWSYAGYTIVRDYDVKDTLKPGKELKAAVSQIVAGASSPDEQLARIYEFCKTRVKNLTYDPSLTEDALEKIKFNKSTFETYQKMTGRSGEINELFASMAAALGFETRLAFGGDRSELFFNPMRAHPSFIHFSSIAVLVGKEWRYFDPGSLFVPSGMLAWNEEDTSVLLLGAKDYIRTETPMSDYRRSAANRTGRFKLLDDGTLEGTVKIEYTGHLSATAKLNNYESSAAKREEDLKESVKKQMSSAEVSEISIDNVMDAEKPITFQYKVRVPNYAQRTGKRLFIQPGFFEYGSQPMFSSATRQYDIYFHFPWSESDDIEIELPKGFTLDNAVQPADLADPSGIGSLKINIGISADKTLLKYSRKFHFGGGSHVLFPKDVYPALKNLFDAFQKNDAHTLTFRQL
jgi:hypothetical protein